jgi:vacuolar-type H+-ATPase subunit F/Vma7
MMARPIFIGDEVAAAGFRLAGADARIAPPGEEAATLEAARATAPLVMIDATVAARLPAQRLRAAVRAPAPITVVVPDLQGAVAIPDFVQRLRLQLGIDA